MKNEPISNEIPRVAVLGPQGTFSEKAVLERWNGNCQIVYSDSIPEIFEFVEKEKVDYGVIPIEDSMEGNIQLSFNLLRDYSLYIVEELRTEVTHCLLAKGRIEMLEEIGSHPQALAHCRKYLDLYFPKSQYRRVQTSSTAEAARIASEKSTFGAIADERTAKIYGLKVLRTDLHDYRSNTTRFFTLSKEMARPTGPAKTFVMVYPKVNRPGVLVKMLEPLAKKNINLAHIASRPYRRTLGEYVFFMDFEGSQFNKETKEVMESIEKLPEVISVKNLGSYSYKEEEEEEEKKAEEIEPIELPKSTFGFWDNKEDEIYDTLP